MHGVAQNYPKSAGKKDFKMNEIKTWVQAMVLIVIGIILLVFLGQKNLANQISILGITLIITALVVAVVHFYINNTGSRIL